MDLFIMKRYRGDSDEESTGSTKKRKEEESDSKNKLITTSITAKKRKEMSPDIKNDSPVKKKTKIEPLSSPVKVEDGLIQNEAKSKPKKKKTKKKKGLASDDFMILGATSSKNNNKNKTKQKVSNWLTNPEIVSMDLQENKMPIEDVPGLCLDLKKKLKSNEINYLFPIQKTVLPYLLDSNLKRYYPPSDLCVSAPTGSGKTLVFVLPIIQALSDRVVPRVRALIVLPVRDLAYQVYKVFQTYSEGKKLSVVLLTGSKSLKEEASELVRHGVEGPIGLADIVVCTPGRLVDHLQKTPGFSLNKLRYLVIDEADRVMESIQNDWLNQVEDSVYTNGRYKPGVLSLKTCQSASLPLQKLLFSATLSSNPEKIREMNLFEPKLFVSSIDPETLVPDRKFVTPIELDEKLVTIQDQSKKPAVLVELLKINEVKSCLVFVNSIEKAHFLAVLLRSFGLTVGELSSAVETKRERILRKFRSGTISILVCTDALARGIDIGSINFVVSYECPKFAQTYVHRVGRTARAGQHGKAYTLVEKFELSKFRKMIKENGMKEVIEDSSLDQENVDNEAYSEARDKASEVLSKEKMSKRKLKKKQISKK